MTRWLDIDAFTDQQLVDIQWPERHPPLRLMLNELYDKQPLAMKPETPGLLTRGEVADMPATALLRATLMQIGKDIRASGESAFFSLTAPHDVKRLAEILGPFLVHDEEGAALPTRPSGEG